MLDGNLHGAWLRRLRRRSWPVLLAAGLLACLAPPPAAAQVEDEPAALGPYGVTLVGQPFSYGSGETLDIRVKVENLSEEPLDGFRLQISSYPRVTSRSALVESFDDDPFGDPQVVTFEQFDATVAAGGTATATLETPLADLATLALATESGGVYPLGIDLADTNGTLLGASVVTELVYYPGDPLETSLPTVLVAPLNEVATRGPDGVFAAGDEGTVPLEEALAPEGWLAGTLAAMEAAAGRPDLHFGLAPTPRLVEEIADMADGYTRRGVDGTEEEVPADAETAVAARAALQTLADLLDTNGVQPLLVPYSFPDLPALAHTESRTGPGPIAPQLTVAEEVLGTLDLTEGGFTRRWVFPPAGRLDGQALEELRVLSAATGSRTFFSAESLVPPADASLGGCPVDFLTFACPVAVGETQGYVADPGLQQRFIALAQPGEDRLDLQRLLAETAMIREEVPGREDRVIQATMPSLWHPRPRLARLLFRALANAPWLTTYTPNQGLHKTTAPVEREAVGIIGDLPRAPEESYFAELAEAEDVVEDLRDIGAPEPLVTRLARDILVGFGRSWWHDDVLAERGAAYASVARAEAEEHLGRIEILAAPNITMTSRSTDVQFLVRNENPYPVRLDVGLESPNLRVAELDVPDEFPADATTPVEASVSAQTSGIFQVSLTATTPAGGEVDELVISVRSTELNQIALGITLGALAFLVSFYVYRGVRRRRGAGDSETATA
ncbi:MAG: DUF6049 family protein [Actinomycetota bacterium]|nr:DUF6049 family protein [Actinomycetota bacterium]